MKPRKPSLTCDSFRNLKTLLKSKSISLPDRKPLDVPTQRIEVSPEVEEKLFRKAMEGVKPIPKNKVVGRKIQIELPEATRDREDAEALEKLVNLVRYGTGFTVSDTPEYIEGTGINVPPSIAERLHRGDFSIQSHVDLHGLRVDDAKETFETFLDWGGTTRSEEKTSELQSRL